MNSIFSIMVCLFASSFFKYSYEGKLIASGRQPQLSTDANGVTRLAFGRNDSILYCAQGGKGGSFEKPQFIASVNKMHLGMSRGPQIASSTHYSMVTAMEKDGNIHWFLIDQKTGRRVKDGLVNDQKGSAPEGLMGLTSDGQDHFYAAWLDLRLNRQNNIYYSSFSTNSGKWSPNQLVYRSPDGHTCECCKPNIAVRGNHIVIMFRNWLQGSRDLYLAESVNGGKSFNTPQKLGKGTWKLKGCPMDGGGVCIEENDHIITTWQREGMVYSCRPGEPEVEIGKGRLCSLSARGEAIVCSYQNGESLIVKNLSSGKETVIGKGSFLKTVITPGQRLVCAWEQDGQVRVESEFVINSL